MKDHSISAAGWAALLCSAALLAGCNQRTESGSGTLTNGTAGGQSDLISNETATTPADGGQDLTSADDSQAKPAKIELEPVDKAGYDAIIKESAGQVVLVDFWGSWCAECMEGFPHTVALSRKYRDKGLKVISYSIEFEEETGRANAVKFLKKTDAGLLRNLTSSIDYEETFEQFDLTALPEYRIYDREGQLVERFNNNDNLGAAPAFDHSDIEQVLRETLGLPPEKASGEKGAE